MSFYFEKFEDRKPPEPLPHHPLRELVWQFLAVVTLMVGTWYIVWCWRSAMNHEALWFSITLFTAETLAFIGLCLFTLNLWKVRDVPMQPPPVSLSDCFDQVEPASDRPLRVDVFFPSYDEDPELVRLSVRDAKKITYPHPIDITIHVLDDGRRPAMEAMAESEEVVYIKRDNNIGFKAGNLRNAMEQTFGDFIVICDADTRPFPTILEHTLGYFRDPKMAWVQTPQWFFDLPEGERLPQAWGRRLGGFGKFAGKCVEAIAGPIQVGHDPFCNDPKMFYDVIQRRRNWMNASFCCGAGSIHRREAVMAGAIKRYAEAIDDMKTRVTKAIGKTNPQLEARLSDQIIHHLALETEFTPYQFHVSEDIYTSILLHSDRQNQWRSVLHPRVESKMLSPQDLLSWTLQRFKYAGGSLDIAFHDNLMFRRGLSLGQKLMYGATFWSYLGGLWNIVFLIAPIIYLFTGISPVASFSPDFFKHLIPFLVLTELTFLVGTWGMSTFQGKTFYLSFFPINLRALWTVLRGKQIKFPTTPKQRQEGVFWTLVWPQMAIIALTAGGLIFAACQIVFGESLDYSGLVTNLFWGSVNMIAMMAMVKAAFWKPREATA